MVSLDIDCDVKMGWYSISKETASCYVRIHWAELAMTGHVYLQYGFIGTFVFISPTYFHQNF